MATKTSPLPCRGTYRMLQAIRRAIALVTIPGLFVFGTVEASAETADPYKREARAFLGQRELPLCCNYEMLWIDDSSSPKKQMWCRTRSIDGHRCEYFGVKVGEPFPIEDPGVWQVSEGPQLPDRYFYTVAMQNPRYQASFVDHGKARKDDSGRSLSFVDQSQSGFRTSTLLEALHGGIMGQDILDIVADESSVFTSMSVRTDGIRPVVRLEFRGKGPRELSASDCIYDLRFDLKTGWASLVSATDVETNEAVYRNEIKYEIGEDDKVVPSLMTLSVDFGKARRDVEYAIRNFSTGCLMQKEEAFLKFHGFPEPFQKTGVAPRWLFLLASGFTGLTLWLILRFTNKPSDHGNPADGATPENV